MEEIKQLKRASKIEERLRVNLLHISFFIYLFIYLDNALYIVYWARALFGMFLIANKSSTLHIAKPESHLCVNI